MSYRGESKEREAATKVSNKYLYTGQSHQLVKYIRLLFRLNTISQWSVSVWAGDDGKGCKRGRGRIRFMESVSRSRFGRNEAAS